MRQRMLACKVISLQESERIAGFYDQTGAHRFELVTAFDGRGGNVPAEFNWDRYIEVNGREPRGGEVGCSVSHFRVLRAFSEEKGAEDDWLLVMEDDSRWSDDFWRVVRRLQRSRISGFVSLGDVFSVQDRWVTMSRSQRSVTLSLLSRPVGRVGLMPRIVGTVDGMMWGTGGYMIDRRAARSLVEKGLRCGIYWNADDFRLWPDSIRFCMVRPGLLRWEGPSTILNTGYQWIEPEIHGLSKVRALLAPRVRWQRLMHSAKIGWQDMGDFMSRCRSSIEN